MSLPSFISSVIADYTTTTTYDTTALPMENTENTENTQNAQNTASSTSESQDEKFGALQVVDPVVTGVVTFSENEKAELPVGTIFAQNLTGDVGKKKVVCPVLPTPYETAREIETLLEDWHPQSLKFQQAGDGTLVRLFFYEGQWLKATNFSLNLTKINPALSQTKSFETMFAEAAISDSLDYSLLDVSRVYFFLLEHPDNIIIIQHKKPKLVFVGSVKVSQKAPFYEPESLSLECSAFPISSSSGSMAFDTVMGAPVLRSALLSNLPPSESLPSQQEQDQKESGKVLHSPVSFVGLIVTRFNQNGFSRFRLDSNEYKAAKELRGRGSANDRRFKLLSILCGPTEVCSDTEKERKLKQFIRVLPNYLPLVQQLNIELDELYHVVFTFYCMFFKDKNPELVAQSCVKFLHKVQKEVFFAKIKPQRLNMTKEHIATFILEQDPKQVMHLLKCVREMKERIPAEELATIMGYTKKK